MGGGGGLLGGGLGSAIGGAVMGPLGSIMGGMKGLGGGNQQGGGGGGIYMPQPNAPTYDFHLGDNGMLNSDLTQQYGSDITPDTTALNTLQSNAMSTAPSAWAQAQSAQAKLQNQGLMDSTQQQNASSNAQAQSSLASKYGLSPGAQQRLAIQNQRNNQSGLQNVGFQGANAQAGIAAQDAANKQNQLMALPGMQLQNSQFDLANRQAKLGQGNFNISNSLNQGSLQNASKANTYNQQMAAWGANNNANSMQAQSGGGKKA